MPETRSAREIFLTFARIGASGFGGVNFWINELNTSARDINNVRFNFLNSPEFGARVQAVINAGCFTGP